MTEERDVGRASSLAHTSGDAYATVLIALVAAVLLGTQGGCGSKGPRLYPLSGDVTYGGEPVPAGTILFEPDTSKGNDGPGSFVEFTGGHYETRPGKGTVGGPHVAHVTGYDGKPVGEAALGMPLFTEYEIPVELPREKATQDLEVPGTHQ